MAGLSTDFPQYAPAADLLLYLGLPSDDTTVPADGLLQRASSAIRDWTKTAFYAVAADGFTPTHTRLANAMHDAAILQAAAYWHAGVLPGMSVVDLPKEVASKTLGARSVTYVANSKTSDALAALVNGSLSPEAFSVLRAARLITTNVATGGRFRA